RQFYTRFLRDLRREPGVESVGAVNCPPSTGGCAKGWYSIADMPSPAPANVPLTLLTRVDRGYFRTTRIPLLAGRGFTDLDRDGGSEAVVNEKLARRWWPEAPQLAVGHRIKFGGPYMKGPTLDIVGVVGDVNQAALDEKSLPEVYVKGAQRGMVVMVRAAGDPVGLIPAVRRELTSLDRNVPIVSIQPFSLRMAATLQRRRFNTLLLGIFATLAVALTATGIYGVFNYWVRARQKEIAIRMALGAPRSEILQWTGWHMLRIAAPGLALGAIGCWGASRVLKSMVFGISAGNPLTFLAASGAVIAMAVLVAIIPVWGAARIDPIRHLHE
ncbi:MAG TPA: FtsX-like permease family protein, partial [Bryobacteraceae bacterium]|nr:FtsX-like permease family protein [Bryobacteraceae bacterium]